MSKEELNHQETYKIGDKFQDISNGALKKDNVFVIGRCVEPETESLPTNNKSKEDELLGIALLNEKGTSYSRLIHVGKCDDIESINADDFRRITSNTQGDFKYLG